MRKILAIVLLSAFTCFQLPYTGKDVFLNDFKYTYVFHLDGHEDELGYVLESTNIDLYNCDASIRKNIISSIYETYCVENPTLMHDLDDDLTFVMSRISP